MCLTTEQMESDDTRAKCSECLRSLGQLSERLLRLREVRHGVFRRILFERKLTNVIILCPCLQIVSLVPEKRRKTSNRPVDDEWTQSAYWQRVAAESFSLLDR